MAALSEGLKRIDDNRYLIERHGAKKVDGIVIP
jgi:hypothetical protein